jgi:hypothetical protein
MPTLASITGWLVVLKVRKTPSGLFDPGPLTTWEAVNGWLNTMLK